MKIAVTYEFGKIFQHFGKTSQFKIYEVDDNKIINSQIVNTMGAGHGALAGFLTMMNVNILICGGIGPGAQNALAEVGITLYGGNSGDADEAVAKLLAEELCQNSCPTCNHHEHGEGHSCGSHSCGNH